MKRGILAIMGLTIGLTGFAAADNAPAWAVGTFHGTNSRYNANVILVNTANGIVSAKIVDRRTGETTIQSGNFDRGDIVLGNNRFTVRKAGRGFVMTQVDDRANTVAYAKERGHDKDPAANFNTVAVPDNPPDWLQGTWTGFNPKYNANVTLRIRPTGYMEIEIRVHRGTTTNQDGSYKSGMLIIDKNVFLIERRGARFLATQNDDHSNVIEFRKK